MASSAFDWLQNKELGWPERLPVNKIDVHHHPVPDFYAKAIEDAGGDPSGWHTPLWTADASLSIMDNLGTRVAILSVTAPGPCIVAEQEGQRRLARQLNDYTASIQAEHPSRIGWFVSLPDLHDTEGALAEIAYGLDVLGADGVVVFTRYGPGQHHYLGHKAFTPIWAELNRRKAVVFVHPTHAVDTVRVNERMLQPLIDYPHETARTAMDMLTQGTRRQFPDCKVILSHAGGTLPYLLGRVAVPQMPPRGTLNEVPLVSDFRSFHFDLAVSSTPAVIKLLRELVPEEHILYGSDFPYAPPPTYAGFARQLEDMELEHTVRDKIYFENAVRLFPRLGNKAAL